MLIMNYNSINVKGSLDRLLDFLLSPSILVETDAVAI